MTKATLSILDTTISPPIRPHPHSPQTPTQLYQALINTGEQEQDFYNFQALQKSIPMHIEELEIIYQGKTVTLPTRISQNLLGYLYQPPYGAKFDSHKFISHISGKLPNIIKPNHEFGQGETLAGDTGLIYNSNEDIIHRQLYLGNDLFLSKGGNLGPLIISTNDAMIKLRGGNKTIIQKH